MFLLHESLERLAISHSSARLCFSKFCFSLDVNPNGGKPSLNSAVAVRVGGKNSAIAYSIYVIANLVFVSGDTYVF